MFLFGFADEDDRAGELDLTRSFGAGRRKTSDGTKFCGLSTQRSRSKSESGRVGQARLARIPTLNVPKHRSRHAVSLASYTSLRS